jgi:hypothetical protein
MTALIVGGDYIDAIKREIVAHGHTEVAHWPGRKTADARRALPPDARLVVVLCDYVSHNLMHTLKRNARRTGAALLFCRHSANELRGKLDALESGTRAPGAANH